MVDGVTGHRYELSMLRSGGEGQVRMPKDHGGRDGSGRGD